MAKIIKLNGNGQNVIAADFMKSGDYQGFLTGADVARDAMWNIFSHAREWNEATKAGYLAKELAELLQWKQLPPEMAGFLSELSVFCGCVANKEVDQSVYVAADDGRVIEDEEAQYLAGVAAGKQALGGLYALYVEGEEEAMVHSLGQSFSDMKYGGASLPPMMEGFFAVLAAFSGVALGGCVISLDEASDMALGIQTAGLEE